MPNLSVDPQNPEKRSVDLLIEIPFKPKREEIKDLHLFHPNIPKDIKFLIHLELERNSPLAKMVYRMKEYTDLITLKYPNAFVLPIVVFFEANLGEIPWIKMVTEIFSQETEVFRFLRVGLKQEKAEDWLKSKHPAMKALAIYMKRNRKQKYVDFIKDVVVSIFSEEIEIFEKDFLIDYVIKSTTLRMNPEEKTKFQQALNKEPVMHTYTLETMKNYFEQVESAKIEGELKGKIEGKIEGEINGKIKGKIEAILNILEYRQIKCLPEHEQQLLAIQDLPKLDEILKLSLTIDSMDQLLASI